VAVVVEGVTVVAEEEEGAVEAEAMAVAGVVAGDAEVQAVVAVEEGAAAVAAVGAIAANAASKDAGF
jgi:hypothetical protein